MQTFLPYADFNLSASVLDNKRLGKQRVEAMQIVNILTNKVNIDNKKIRWVHHPAVLMWQDYIEALKLYFNIISKEWINRGYEHNLCLYDINYINLKFPYWLGNDKFHIAHKSNLLRKKYDWYIKFFNVPIDISYYWPIKNINK